MRVNHPSQAVAGEGLDGFEAAQPASNVEQIKAASARFQVQVSTDREHRIANWLGVQAAHRETPEQTDVGVALLRFIHDF